MNQYSIWQCANFSISQSYDFPLPGYLFVECISGVKSLAALTAQDSVELGSVLKRAEHIVETLIKPERIYVLKFGESDQRVHFHMVPRTSKLLEAYLKSTSDKPPYNGALITAWVWSNARALNHTEEEIRGFISAARSVVAP
ncbi:hypothetical protein EGJ52_17120 [Pseudomonas luteola]|nr:hypothetical protein EGJ52_17120 [Pseudomonas luteola]